MSNLIKSPFVNLVGKEAVVIDSEHRGGTQMSATSEEASEPMEPISQTEEDKLVDRQTEATKEQSLLMAEEIRLQASAEAEKILADARSQADMILSMANDEVEVERRKARSEGYAAGEVEAREKYDQLQLELSQQIQDNQKEYQSLLDEIEPRYVDVLISLLEKLTGVIIEDHRDVILYLIRNAISNAEPSTHYIIRTSTEDAVVIDSKHKEIRELLGENANVEFVEEKNLKQNQCIIETDHQMIDCGIETQLNSLIEALKMLVS